MHDFKPNRVKCIEEFAKHGMPNDVLDKAVNLYNEPLPEVGKEYNVIGWKKFYPSSIIATKKTIEFAYQLEEFDWSELGAGEMSWNTDHFEILDWVDETGYIWNRHHFETHFSIDPDDMI